MRPCSSRTPWVHVATISFLAAALFACGTAAPGELEGTASQALARRCPTGQELYCEPGAHGKMVCVCEDDTSPDSPDAGGIVAPPDSGSACQVPGESLCQCSQCPSYCTANSLYCLDLVNGYCAPGTQCVER